MEGGKNIYGTQSTKLIFIIRYSTAISKRKSAFYFSGSFVAIRRSEVENEQKSIPMDHPDISVSKDENCGKQLKFVNFLQNEFLLSFLEEMLL